MTNDEDNYELLITGSLFAPGSLYATRAAKAAMQAHNCDFQHILKRHVTGDWSDLEEQYIENNRQAVKNGTYITAMYHIGDGDMVWVCTRADRTLTTFDLIEADEDEDDED